jgi:hypothetical protein
VAQDRRQRQFGWPWQADERAEFGGQGRCRWDGMGGGQGGFRRARELRLDGRVGRFERLAMSPVCVLLDIRQVCRRPWRHAVSCAGRGLERLAALLGPYGALWPPMWT